MNISLLLLPALLALSAAPADTQCGPGRGGHSPAQDHPRPKEDSPKAKATNKICPVMGRTVKPGRNQEVVIRGNNYLVCCDGCGPAIAENPDKYLDKDGTPLNAPKNDSKKDAGKPAPPPAHEGHQH